MYRYAYLVGNGIIAIFWLLFFFLRKDLRKQQLFLSFLLAPFAPLTDFLWFYHDYWQPEYVLSFKIADVTLGLESPLFAFLIGGVSGVIYEVVFQKRHSYGKRRGKALFIIIPASVALMFLLILLRINSIWACTITILTICTTLVLIDNDILKDAIISGLLVLFLIIVVYFVWLSFYPRIIPEFWIVENLSGIYLWKIPIEELVWFLSAGLCGGIIYEFWLNVEKYPKKRLHKK